MKRIILSLFLTVILFLSFFLISKTNENMEKYNIYYNSAVVIELGQCSKSECSFKYKTPNGETMFGTSDSPVSVGQIVYQQCWTEKERGDRCYISYSPFKN